MECTICREPLPEGEQIFYIDGEPCCDRIGCQEKILYKRGIIELKYNPTKEEEREDYLIEKAEAQRIEKELAI